METYPGYLKGYKIIYFLPYAETYCSPYRVMGWTGVDKPAICKKNEPIPHDTVPDLECTCGYYAYLEYEYALKEIIYMADVPTACLAVVDAYGKVVLHELGFRSRFMKIRTIMPLQKLEPNMLDKMETVAHKRVGANFCTLKEYFNAAGHKLY